MGTVSVNEGGKYPAWRFEGERSSTIGWNDVRTSRFRRLAKLVGNLGLRSYLDELLQFVESPC